jgi:hypothetical protein
MGLEAPSLFASTSACIEKRSRLVPTASVLSLLAIDVFWSIWHVEDAHHGTGSKEQQALLLPHEQDGSRPSFLLASTSACIQKRSGLVPTVSVLSFGLLMCFGPICCIHTRLDDEMDSVSGIPHERDGLRASFLFATTSACTEKWP